MHFGSIPKARIMINTAIAANLYPVQIVVIMHHLVQKSGYNVLNRAVERTSTEVDLLVSLSLDTPCVEQGKMPVGFGRRLDGEITGRSSSPAKKSAFSASKIWLRYPATRLYLVKGFMIFLLSGVDQKGYLRYTDGTDTG